MKRRSFLKYSALSTAAITTSSLGLLESCNTNIISPKWNGKRLIIVKLDGGNDSLFSMCPTFDKTIIHARPKLYSAIEKNAIEVQNSWILNGHFKQLHELYKNEELLFLPLVGYPKPNTSHFKSAEIWETAYLPSESHSKSGWIGRYLNSKNKTNELVRAINVHENHTLYDKSDNDTAYSWINNEPLNWYSSQINDFLLNAESPEIVEKVNKQKMLMQWLNDIQIQENENQSLNAQLQKATEIILKEKPFQIIHCQQSGYDTHIAELDRLPKLYTELDRSLFNLRNNLSKDGFWNNTVVFVYSEFGRTIDENQNIGTDHGSASFCMLLGGNLKESLPSSQNYSKLPENILFQKYNLLQETIDFRDLYTQFITYLG